MGERTLPVPIRLSQAERARLAALLAHYPELATRSDLLRQALTLGTMLMAVQATRPGQPLPYAGYTPEDLAALLASRLLPALALLQARGALSAHVVPASPWPNQGEASGEVAGVAQTDAVAQQIDASAANDFAAMGTDFLD